MIYKITIEEITEKEIPETDYKDLGRKDDNGEPVYGYVETGKMEIKRETREIYVQEVRELDLGELAIFINRAR